MKKVISLFSISLIAITAICQDTSSMRRNPSTGNFDTIPNMNNKQPDTSKWNNYNKDSTRLGNQNPSLDTTRQQQPMEGSRDSLNRGITPNTSSDTLNKNQGNSGMNNTDSSKMTNNTGNTNSSTTSGSKDSSTTTTVAEKVSDRVAMADDKVYVIKNGDSSILNKEYKLSSGASVLPDGTVKYPTGKSVMLKNGQFIELLKKTTEEATKEETTTPAKKKVIKKLVAKKTIKKTTGNQ